ncbi:hypothetical protein EDD99_2561 [Streptomyces sp. 846.5]|nr:hypothetical protein EDD99_2561 [Streptomyces sp. 846.5]
MLVLLLVLLLVLVLLVPFVVPVRPVPLEARGFRGSGVDGGLLANGCSTCSLCESRTSRISRS